VSKTVSLFDGVFQSNKKLWDWDMGGENVVVVKKEKPKKAKE